MQQNNIKSEFSHLNQQLVFDWLNSFKLPSDFSAWHFTPEMTFGAAEQWWDSNPRKQNHNGVDLAEYLNSSGSITKISESLDVPIFQKGIIVRSFDSKIKGGDYIAETVIVRHPHYKNKNDNAVLHSIYGHIGLRAGLNVGSELETFESIGQIAVCKSKGIPTHLHFSLYWINETVDPLLLNWNVLSEVVDVCQVINPFKFLES